jgi:hypothetical protein
MAIQKKSLISTLKTTKKANVVTGTNENITAPEAAGVTKTSMRAGGHQVASLKGANKGFLKGSAKGSLKGQHKGFLKGSAKGSLKGSQKGSLRGSHIA